MILFRFTLITLQPIMAEAAAIATGFVITALLAILAVQFIRSVFEE